MAILMMRFVYLIRLQLVLNKQMNSVTYRGSKKKLLKKSIIRDIITQNRQRKNVHYMQEKTKDGSILIISHQERILDIADEIVVISAGQIINHGPKDEILPQLLGTSSAVNMCDKFNK